MKSIIIKCILVEIDLILIHHIMAYMLLSPCGMRLLCIVITFFDVSDANGKNVSGGGNLFEPCRTKITYKYYGMRLVVDKAYEQIAYEL